MTKGHRLNPSSLSMEQLEALYSEPIICNTPEDAGVIRFEVSELKAVITQLTKTQSELAEIKRLAQAALGQRLSVLRELGELGTNHTK